MNKINRHKLFPLVSILIIFILSLLFFELFLKNFSKDDRKGNFPLRNIVLREHSPMGLDYFQPTKKELNSTSTLENKIYKLEIDSIGFITPSGVHENPDMKIIFYGGSSTECLYVDENKRFPYLVGKNLSKFGKKINSYNGGRSGNHSLHSINRLLNDGLKIKPDIVLLLHNINDLNYLIYEGDYWNYNEARGLIQISNLVPNHKHATIKNFIQRLIPNIYKRLFILKNKLFKKQVDTDAFRHVRSKDILINNELILEKFEKNIKTFIEICEIHNVIPILMTQFNRITNNPDEKILKNMERIRLMNIKYEDYKIIYDKMNDKIREISLDNNILFIDLDLLLPKDSLYMYDPIHLTEKGSVYVSEIVSNALEDIILDK